MSVSAIPEIQDSFALTPVQHGMLVHRLRGGSPGVDVEQVTCSMGEALDPEAFARAWRAMAARHAVLRTRFAWIGLESPRQEVG